MRLSATVRDHQEPKRGGPATADSFDLTFARMEMSVAPRDQDGDAAQGTTAGWDFLTRVPFESKGCA